MDKNPYKSMVYKVDWFSFTVSDIFERTEKTLFYLNILVMISMILKLFRDVIFIILEFLLVVT